jgi:thioredoxin-like negative regulator of GroEL
MLTLVIAALTAVHTAAALPAVRATASTPIVAEPARSAEHIAKARRALDQGELQEARREYVIASALDRDEGKLPTEAVFGLAQVLYSQFDEKGAAKVLDQLADEAAAKGDVDTEARALADATWLNVNTQQIARARIDAERLRELMQGAHLSPETRAFLAKRVR